MAIPDKGLSISTIPIPKLSALLNDFITKTTNHLNKLSVSVDDKLHDFDKKLQDLEVMTTLLEAKINSLPPEITAQYPPLIPCTLDDVNPSIIVIQQPIADPTQVQQQQQQQAQQAAQPEAAVQPEPVPEEPAELSPQEQLDKFLEINNEESYTNLCKLLKMKVTEAEIMQKAQFRGMNMDIVTELIDLYKKAHPY